MKQFEVRAIGSNGIKLFRVVNSEYKGLVLKYFHELLFTSICVQEVPMSNAHTLTITREDVRVS